MKIRQKILFTKARPHRNRLKEIERKQKYRTNFKDAEA
jgi:hypothetical protein